MNGRVSAARMWQILELSHPEDRVGRIMDRFLILIIFGSVVAIVLESLPRLEATYAEYFLWIEVVTVAIFTVEYVLRLWCVVGSEKYANSGLSPLQIRLRFIFSPYAIIDFLAILPFYLLMFGLAGDVDMRFLRIVRLLRILKLTRYSSAFDILATTCKENTRPLTAAFLILITVMLLAASGMYFFERHVQPVAFGSIPDAMWWAVSTLTTVGYGDVTPITVGGKMFGAVVTIIGVGMVALPTGILASGYAAQSSMRLLKYRQEASRALDDGVITQEESLHLEKTRVAMSVSSETASQILDDERATLERASQTTTKQPADAGCPHCGKSSSPAKGSPKSVDKLFV